MRTTWTFLLAALLLTLGGAGCIGGEDAAEPAQGEALEPTDAEGETSAEADATENGSEASSEGTSDTPSAEPVEHAHELAWEGQLGTFACAPAGPNACFGVLLSEFENVHELEAPGSPARVNATLTWESTSPLTQTLEFAVTILGSCGDGCTSFQDMDWVAGTSPLELTVDVSDQAANATLALHVDQPRLTPDPVYAKATLEQPFTVAGTYVTLEEPDAHDEA